MKHLRHQSLQFQIKNLIPILELWIALLEETKKTQTNLEELPDYLEDLKQQVDVLELNKGEDKISQEIDAKLQAIIGNLQAKLPQLVATETKINNLVALQERLEALQERELEPVPNHLDELIRLQNNSDAAEKQVSDQQKWRQVIDKHQPKDLRLGITIFVSVLISWGTAFIVVDNYKTETNLLTEKIEELETRLQQLENEATPNRR